MKKPRYISQILACILLFAFLPAASAAAAADDVVNIPDINLKNALITNGVDTNGNGSITQGELSAVTGLTLSDSAISSLSGLQYAVNLDYLDLAANSIADISALSSLTGLTHLYLNNNQIQSISALSALTALHTLDLSQNSIADLTAFQGHSSLYWLNLSHNNITSLAGFQDFTALNYLFLTGNQISGISALSGFTGQFLYLSDNAVADISPLAEAAAVSSLSLENNRISDTSVLNSRAMHALFLGGNYITDISALTGQPGLLSVHNNYIDIKAGMEARTALDQRVTAGASVKFAPQKLERLSGTSRVDTANAIACKGWQTAQNVILASGMNFPDSLCGIPLAKALDAPILLTTNPDTGLEQSVKDVLESLQAQKVYILGGSGVVSEGIASYLQTQYTVERLSGANRYTTSVRIAEKLWQLNAPHPSQASLIDSSNWVDAAGITTANACNGVPILYTYRGVTALHTDVAAFITQNNVQEVDILGGPLAVAQEIENTLAGQGITVTRISGSSRYATSIAVYEKYYNESLFDGSVVSLVSGDDSSYPDAIAGASLAAKQGSPILLVNDAMTEAAVRNVLTGNAPASFVPVPGRPGKVYVFGGTLAVSEQTVKNYLS